MHSRWLIHQQGLALSVLAMIALTSIPAHGSPPNLGDGAWSTIPADSLSNPGSTPQPRMLYVGAWDSARNRTIIFGGHPYFLNDTWVLGSGPNAQWEPLATAGTPPSPRYGSYGVYDALNDRLIVFAGYDGNLNNDVWALSLSGSPTWTQIHPAGMRPSARYYGATVYDPVNQRMVIFGGYDGGWTNDTWILTLGSNPTWSQVPSFGPPARDLTHAIYDPARQRMVMFGGWTSTDYLNDVWQLSLDASPTWTPLPTTHTPSARRENTAIYDPQSDRMVIFGGLQDATATSPLSEAWELDFATNNWQSIPVTPPVTGRTALEAVYDPVSRRMIVHGGYGYDEDAGGSLNYLNQTLFLALDGAPTWSGLAKPVASSISPSARREYSAAYDPDDGQMILFSGTVGAPRGHDTWALSLDDAAHPWHPISTVTAPHSRHGHLAIWDPLRHRMLMLGGYDDVDLIYANDLWQFTLSPQAAWTELHPAGIPPSGRMLFGLIYDPVRDRLLVFGGHPTYLNDLWELPLSGPNAMTWNELHPSGAIPPARWGAGMFYDPANDRALVYGGTDGQARRDVWQLSLATNPPSWSDVTPGNSGPDARFLYAGVYDPDFDRIVIYGGADDRANFYSDAWELRIENVPTWRRLTPDGPSPGDRDLITAIDDPAHHQMVFFGGYDNTPSTFFADTWFLKWRTSRIQVDGEAKPFVKPGARPLDSDGSVSEVRLVQAVYEATTHSVRAQFELPRQGRVRLVVVDVAGRVVGGTEGGYGPGRHDAFIASGTPLSSGMYFARLESMGKIRNSKILVLK